MPSGTRFLPAMLLAAGLSLTALPESSLCADAQPAKAPAPVRAPALSGDEAKVLIGSYPEHEPAVGEPGGPDLTLLSLGVDTAPTAARISLKRRGYLLPRTYYTDIYTVQEYTAIKRTELFHTVHVVSCTDTQETVGIYYSSASADSLLELAQKKFHIRAVDTTVHFSELFPGGVRTKFNYRRVYDQATASYYKVKDFPTWVLALENGQGMQACLRRMRLSTANEQKARQEIRKAVAQQRKQSVE